MKIKMTAVQRLNLISIIRVQQPPNFDQLETLSDILTKVDFPAEVLQQVTRELPTGFSEIIKSEAAKVADEEIDLEKAEAKLVSQLLNPNDRFRPTVQDLPWLKPLRTALHFALGETK